MEQELVGGGLTTSSGHRRHDGGIGAEFPVAQAKAEGAPRRTARKLADAL